jgi:hypothetical protein
MPKGIYKNEIRYDYNTTLFAVDSETKYYLLGLILADGYISHKHRYHRIELGLQERDKGFLSMIRDLVCPGKPLKYKQKQKAYRLQIDNKDIWTAVCSYVNELPKSLNLLFPYGIPDEYLLPFIRGYSDGDGNISVKYGRRKLADGTRAKYFGLRYRLLGTKQFLMGVEFNLRRIGVTKTQVKAHKKENIYYLEWGFFSAFTVLTALYKDANIFLGRKRQVFEKISGMDSAELERAYGTPEGRYNTHGTAGSGKGIVGAPRKLGGVA